MSFYDNLYRHSVALAQSFLYCIRSGEEANKMAL